ncbi:MAG: histidine phosphatase family protein [Candidatus Aenigmarchaeota archaeon]|nr:histidine phosphatase family protein [Candidatus Aenigmarchaeota archaeon]
MKIVKITYFVHGTSTDNENKISTGWNQGELSELGKKQSIELKSIVREKEFDVVFCSDLRRAVDSANIVFGDRSIPIVRDEKLREANYGDLNGAPSIKVEPNVLDHLEQPFPNGESYRDVERRIRHFLNFLLEKYPGKKVAIVAHKAPQLALEVVLNKKTWEQAVKEDWRLKREWKPGWDYRLEG